MAEKVCPKCTQPKDLNEFPKNKSKADGRGVYCKECHRRYTGRHYAQNKAYYIDKALRRNKTHAAALRTLIATAKDKPCVDCGRKFPPCAMDFDHVRGKKVRSISQMRWMRETIERVRVEISKCEVRCAVCHRLRTHGIQITPS